MNYQDFLEQKKKTHIPSGFDVAEIHLHPILFPFQKFIVRKSLRHGRYAIFSECGTGKTLMQLEWARHVVDNTNEPVLILCPLAVSAQTIEEGKKLNLKVDRYKGQTEPAIYITNYEQIEHINQDFAGVVLATKQNFVLKTLYRTNMPDKK